MLYMQVRAKNNLIVIYMSDSKKACMFSSQGEFKCCDPSDTACFYDIPVGIRNRPLPQNVQQERPASYAPNKPSAAVIEKFTKNAPLFEKFENNEPVGIASGFIGQFQSLDLKS